MRMRAKKHREERLSAVEDCFVKFTEDGKLDIENSFKPQKSKTYLELGCGKGTFAVTLALRESDADIIAVEKVRDVVLLAMEKAYKAGAQNVKFANLDIEKASELFPESFADAIFINFCDPWPKKRNAKRRLTSPSFLALYKRFLKPGAKIFFKTDNIGLFEYSLETFPACGYVTENVCFDLHNDEKLNKTNIETEYEKNFSEKGFKINYLEAYPDKNK